MLSPEARTVAIEFLRPPPGHRLDSAVLTTYTLDLEALLALPLGVLAQADAGLEGLLADPLLLLEALREAGDRVHVFVDEGGIAIPRAHRELYAMLESSVHPVRAPHGGAFHPKVWVIRYVSEDDDDDILLRVGVMSRNLTFDRSWDVALASEAPPLPRQRARASGPLADLLRELPKLATERLPDTVQIAVRSLADQAGRTRFPAPEGFHSRPVEFYLLGLVSRQSPWQPTTGGSRVLAIAPFVNRAALDAVAGMSTGKHMLVSRQEELDNLSNDALAAWSENVLVLQDVALDETEDGDSGTYRSGLHAKIIAVEHGYDVTWYVGSANITAAAFTGHNVEMMAAATGRKGRPFGNSGCGIERFFESGFHELCMPYRRSDGGEDDGENDEAAQARQLIEDMERRLIEAPLKIVCKQAEGGFTWRLEGRVPQSEVEIAFWPVSVSEDKARPLDLPTTWPLPLSHLTSLVAFRLRVAHPSVEDIRLTRKLPTQGMPEGRINAVLRSLIDSPERFLQFLRALLGGFEGMVAWAQGDGSGTSQPWGDWLAEETLLEDLLRVASRHPERLNPIRRLIDELLESKDGDKVIPEGFLASWQAVAEAIDGRAS